MKRNNFAAVLAIGAVAFGAATVVSAQEPVTAPPWKHGPVSTSRTFRIADAVDAGPGFGIGAGVQIATSSGYLAMSTSGSTRGRPGGGIDGPDVKVYHYIAKLGYEIVPASESPVVGDHQCGCRRNDVQSRRAGVQHRIRRLMSGPRSPIGSAPGPRSLQPPGRYRVHEEGRARHQQRVGMALHRGHPLRPLTRR